jgi:hypothetical protein
MDHTENNASNNPSIVACVFIATVTFLLSCCLATYTYRHPDCWEGFKKYAVEMGSSAMIYMPSFMKTGSGIQNLMGGIHRHKQERGCIGLL